MRISRRVYYEDRVIRGRITNRHYARARIANRRRRPQNSVALLCFLPARLLLFLLKICARLLPII